MHLSAYKVVVCISFLHVRVGSISLDSSCLKVSGLFIISDGWSAEWLIFIKVAGHLLGVCNYPGLCVSSPDSPRMSKTVSGQPRMFSLDLQQSTQSSIARWSLVVFSTQISGGQPTSPTPSVARSPVSAATSWPAPPPLTTRWGSVLG